MFFWRFMRDRLGNFLSEMVFGRVGEVPGRMTLSPSPVGMGDVPAPCQPPGGKFGPMEPRLCVFVGEMAREGSVWYMRAAAVEGFFRYDRWAGSMKSLCSGSGEDVGLGESCGSRPLLLGVNGIAPPPRSPPGPAPFW